jgi:hypothetical protein
MGQIEIHFYIGFVISRSLVRFRRPAPKIVISFSRSYFALTKQINGKFYDLVSNIFTDALNE